MTGANPRVLVALDFASPMRALALAERLDPAACATVFGMSWNLRSRKTLKPCAAATRLGVWMLDEHAAGGSAMLHAACDAVRATVAETGMATPLLIGVTVLTSLDAAALRETGVDAEPGEQALRLAALAQACGLDGVVCSARESAAMRARFGPEFARVTPGIRPQGSPGDDQARSVTPEEAMRNGASYLVVGRPITSAADPLAALASINRALGIGA